MEFDTDQIRPTNSRRSLSLLIVVALALQVGLGLGESAALLRESASQTNAIRALAEAVVRYASKPVKAQQERPFRVSTRELDKLAGRSDAGPQFADVIRPRMLLTSLLALPPPIG